MKRICSLVFTLIGLTTTIKAQEPAQHAVSHAVPIPVEVTVGHESSLYQMIVSQQFDKSKRFGYFNLLNYEVDYESESPDVYIVQSIFSYSFSRHFSLGAGANLKAFGGFQPLIAAAYTFFNRDFGVVLQPSIELSNDGIGEVFALFEWHPHRQSRVKPYANVQGVTSYKTDDGDHDFSYLYLKAGVQVGKFRFGPALNFQEIGTGDFAQSKTNAGGFVSILIP